MSQHFVNSETPTILVRHGDSSTWTTPETAAYHDESHLQTLLAADPSHIPGVMAGAVVVRELPTSAGPIDLCVIGVDGSVTVVECKLAKTSEHRRTIVGQVVDYASALRADGIESFYDRWTASGGADLDDLLDRESAEALRDNFASGRINLCLAVDQIDADIRRLIEYLNQVTTSEIMVTALQLVYARHGSTEILIPSTFGAEIAASKSSPRTRRDPWTWESFIDALSNPVDREIAEDLRQRLDSTPLIGGHERLWFGSRPGGGVFFHPHGERYSPFQLWQNSTHQLRVFGNWRQWNALSAELFAELAIVLGQSHVEGPKGVAATELEIDRFWKTVLRCNRLINGPGGTTVAKTD
jgi:hypothetical protein